MYIGNANRRIQISFDNTGGAEGDPSVANAAGAAPMGFMGQGNTSVNG